MVSILFLDVVGSTAVVQAHGGRVLQVAVDHLLAGFGTREVHENDAERAVRCGLALLAEGRRKQGGWPARPEMRGRQPTTDNRRRGVAAASLPDGRNAGRRCHRAGKTPGGRY